MNKFFQKKLLNYQGNKTEFYWFHAIAIYRPKYDYDKNSIEVDTYGLAFRFLFYKVILLFRVGYFH